MLISPAYREQNRQLHERNAGYGTSGKAWAPNVKRLVDDEGYATILDYGAGKQTLAKALPDLPIVSYDPCIPGLDAAPEPADLVVCGDVLEHIEPVHLNAVLRDLARVTRRKLFFVIATRPAGKTLPDGRNAHLIVKDPQWWLRKLRKHFHVITYHGRPGDMVHGEAVPKHLLKLTADRPKERRPLTPGWAAQFETIKEQINAYADPFTRAETCRMWEWVDDEPADVQVACHILENLADVESALDDLARHAVKAVFCIMALDGVRGLPYWRYVFSKYFRIGRIWEEHGHVLVYAAPMVGVQGVHVVGAVESTKRWEQVKAAIARFPRRIETAPAHERRAIVACYGPSLGDTIELMRRERDDTGAAVVSVSGAHDFLLKHGIVPDYHVECDPRPHKADNIDAWHPGVQYLLASCVSPVLFDKLGPEADIRLWHISAEDHTMRLIDELGEKPEHVISGGGSVGLRSIPLLYAMGFRNMSIHAMDCSFADDGKTQWAGAHAGKRQDLCTVEIAGRVFVSSPILVSYATNFWEMAQKVPELEFRLFGNGLLQWWAHNLGFEPKMLEPQKAA